LASSTNRMGRMHYARRPCLASAPAYGPNLCVLNSQCVPMAFITEYLQHTIKSHMEDPEERRKKWEDHVRKLERNSERKKEEWKQPTKPWGFWNSERANAKFTENSQPAVKALYGRHTQLDR